MKKYILFSLIVCSLKIDAQQFINSGSIEYEVRTNNHKMLGDDLWGQMMKDKFPQFSNTYYRYTFNDNKGIYKFDHYDESNKMPRGWSLGNPEDNIWFNDYQTGNFVNLRSVDDNYLVSGALAKIEWKLSPNETREIAGFNCRKATGVLFDSVYVFAFYTEEITVPGGPMGVSGLPGMILGITVPRMFTSWIATRLQVAGVDTRIITPPMKGKKKDAVELRKNIEKVTKDWGSYGQQFVWSMFL